VFENRVLRRTFGSKRGEVAGSWRKLQYEKVLNFFSTPDIDRGTKPRMMSCAEHAVQERVQDVCRNTKGKGPLER
jgi:hypothetical protein